jgi:serine/threonine-protein kinase
VLAGAGATSASTMVTRPRAVAPPPAPPAYRPPLPYYDYEEPAPGRSLWPWLLALGLIVLGAVGGWLLYTRIQHQLSNNTPVAVPDTRLMVQRLAVEKIRQAGFTPQIERQASASVAKGAVISESPDPGTKVGKGSTVTLVVSTGIPKTTVPGVKGQKLTDALQLLYSAGLQPKIAYVYSEQPSDVVVAQSPSATSTVARGSNVRINVSKGPKPVGVPDVTGQPFANAQSALQGQGFVVSRVDIQSDQPKGVVVSSDPPPGTSVAKGSKVVLSVSKGPGTTQVPDVTQQDQQTATSLLRNAGFSVAVVYQQVNDPSQDGVVLSQDPVGGQTGTSGETVIITVGRLAQGSGNGNGNGNGGSGGTTTPTTTAGTTPTGQ